ncbi:MAG TPA: hypothetical protein VHH90_08250 [Polyangia bacterium]|nr:hypothetical protein [Polyangia bacterium]
MSAPAPPRPAPVPAAAVWNAESGEWELCATGPDGARHGECVTFRADGALQERRAFVNGVPDGPFTVYHPDGQIARRGKFVAGSIEGIVSSFAGGPDGDPLRPCCVPAGAVRLDIRYEAGAIVQEEFFDAAGRAVLADGTPRPARPPGVPEDADYDPSSGDWSRWRRTEHRVWSAAGVLVREVELDAGVRRAERSFDDEGELRESSAFDGQQRSHGPYRRRFPPGTPTPFADPRIREERGTFDGGQPTGVWVYLDGAGEVLRTVDRGAPFQAESAQASPALADDGGATAGVWLERARLWRAEGRVREALCAAARAAALSRSPAVLLAALDGSVAPLASAVAAEQGELLLRGAEVTVPQALDALVGGTDPVAALRALAGVLPGASQAALELVEAALLLAPGHPGAHLTRALLRFQHGDTDGTASDLTVVERHAPETAAALHATLAATFRPFTFVPAGETLTADPALADVGACVVRDLAEVRRVIAVYATRLGALRAAAQTKGPRPDVPWLPPDLGALLPEGPIALGHERTSPPPEAEDPSPVEVDERLDAAGLTVPALLTEAQADWSALCWLCWSVGLDALALPSEIAERPLMPVAMQTIVTRCWRVQDQLKTGGFLAHCSGVSGFRWHGLDIDGIQPHLARIIAEEYLRVRAMFLWLASPDVVSPFQVDLRND